MMLFDRPVCRAQRVCAPDGLLGQLGSGGDAVGQSAHERGAVERNVNDYAHWPCNRMGRVAVSGYRRRMAIAWVSTGTKRQRLAVGHDGPGVEPAPGRQ